MSRIGDNYFTGAAGSLEADRKISSRKRLHVGIQDLPKGSGIKVALS
jgi:hypothetical protein